MRNIIKSISAIFALLAGSQSEAAHIPHGGELCGNCLPCARYERACFMRNEVIRQVRDAADLSKPRNAILSMEMLCFAGGVPRVFRYDNAPFIEYACSGYLNFDFRGEDDDPDVRKNRSKNFYMWIPIAYQKLVSSLLGMPDQDFARAVGAVARNWMFVTNEGAGDIVRGYFTSRTDEKFHLILSTEPV